MSTVTTVSDWHAESARCYFSFHCIRQDGTAAVEYIAALATPICNSAKAVTAVGGIDKVRLHDYADVGIITTSDTPTRRWLDRRVPT